MFFLFLSSGRILSYCELLLWDYYKNNRMKKFIIILVSIIVTSCSSDTPKIGIHRYLDENVEVASHFAKKDVYEYTKEKMIILKDSLDNSSGFLGWRNIRDYVHLGDETMKEKVNRIWKGIYKVKDISNLVNEHINGLASGTTLISKKFYVELEYNNYIGNYSHKIGLSFGIMILEFIIDAFVAYWMAFVIGFIIAFVLALFGVPFNISSTFIIILTVITFIVSFIISLKTERLSQEKLIKHIAEKITNSTMEIVDGKFDEINFEYNKIKLLK